MYGAYARTISPFQNSDMVATGLPSPDELKLLDIGTRRAEKHLAEMAGELDRVNAKLDAAFAQLDRQHRRVRKAA